MFPWFYNFQNRQSRDIPTPVPRISAPGQSQRTYQPQWRRTEPANFPADSAALHVAFPRAWQEVERASRTWRDLESTIAILGPFATPLNLALYVSALVRVLYYILDRYNAPCWSLRMIFP